MHIYWSLSKAHTTSGTACVCLFVLIDYLPYYLPCTQYLSENISMQLMHLMNTKLHHVQVSTHSSIKELS